MDKELKKILRVGITGKAVAYITKPEPSSANTFEYFLQGANAALRFLDVHYSEAETEIIDGAVDPVEIPVQQAYADAYAEGYAEIVRRVKVYENRDLPELGTV